MPYSLIACHIHSEVSEKIKKYSRTEISLGRISVLFSPHLFVHVNVSELVLNYLLNDIIETKPLHIFAAMVFIRITSLYEE